MTIEATTQGTAPSVVGQTLPAIDQQAIAGIHAEIIDLLHQIKRGLSDFFDSQGITPPDKFSFDYHRSHLSIDASPMQRHIEDEVNRDGQLMSKFNHLCDYARKVYGMEGTHCQDHAKLDFNELFYQSMSVSFSATHEDGRQFHFEWEASLLKISNGQGWEMVA